MNSNNRVCVKNQNNNKNKNIREVALVNKSVRAGHTGSGCRKKVSSSNGGQSYSDGSSNYSIIAKRNKNNYDNKLELNLETVTGINNSQTITNRTRSIRNKNNTFANSVISTVNKTPTYHHKSYARIISEPKNNPKGRTVYQDSSLRKLRSDIKFDQPVLNHPPPVHKRVSVTKSSIQYSKTERNYKKGLSAQTKNKVSPSFCQFNSTNGRVIDNELEKQLSSTSQRASFESKRYSTHRSDIKHTNYSIRGSGVFQSQIPRIRALHNMSTSSGVAFTLPKEDKLYSIYCQQSLVDCKGCDITLPITCDITLPITGQTSLCDILSVSTDNKSRVTESTNGFQNMSEDTSEVSHIETTPMEDTFRYIENTSDNIVDTSDNIVNTSDNIVDTSDNIVDTSDNIVDTSDNIIDTSDNIVDTSDNATGVNLTAIESSNLCDEATISEVSKTPTGESIKYDASVFSEDTSCTVKKSTDSGTMTNAPSSHKKVKFIIGSGSEDDDEDGYYKRYGEDIAEKPVACSPDGRFLKFNDEIGRGSFKSVYRGLDTETGVSVAWCELQDKKLTRADRLKFRDEAQMLKSLQHPNIVRFFDYWEVTQNKRKYFVLVTELMTSGTLRSYVKRLKKVNLRILKSWCRQILKGLSFLHSRSPPIIHRDLKCDNIFVTGTTGTVKIGDLGLATLKNRSYAKSVIGTPEFMAPEMYEEHYDESVDIYAFGMCIIELVTSEYPYNECNGPAQIYKKVINRIKPLSYLRIEDEEVRHIIDLCIAWNKDERPTVKELLQNEFFLEDLGLKLDVLGRDEAVIMDTNLVRFQLRIYDSKKQCHRYKEDEAIQFVYDLSEDNAEQIANDMANSGLIFQDDVRLVSQLIIAQVINFQRDREQSKKTKKWKTVIASFNGSTVAKDDCISVTVGGGSHKHFYYWDSESKTVAHHCELNAVSEPNKQTHALSDTYLHGNQLYSNVHQEYSKIGALYKQKTVNNLHEISEDQAIVQYLYDSKNEPQLQLEENLESTFRGENFTNQNFSQPSESLMSSQISYIEPGCASQSFSYQQEQLQPHQQQTEQFTQDVTNCSQQRHVSLETASSSLQHSNEITNYHEQQSSLVQQSQSNVSGLQIQIPKLVEIDSSQSQLLFQQRHLQQQLVQNQSTQQPRELHRNFSVQEKTSNVANVQVQQRQDFQSQNYQTQVQNDIISGIESPQLQFINRAPDFPHQYLNMPGQQIFQGMENVSFHSKQADNQAQNYEQQQQFSQYTAPNVETQQESDISKFAACSNLEKDVVGNSCHRHQPSMQNVDPQRENNYSEDESRAKRIYFHNELQGSQRPFDQFFEQSHQQECHVVKEDGKYYSAASVQQPESHSNCSQLHKNLKVPVSQQHFTNLPPSHCGYACPQLLARYSANQNQIDQSHPCQCILSQQQIMEIQHNVHFPHHHQESNNSSSLPNQTILAGQEGIQCMKSQHITGCTHQHVHTIPTEESTSEIQSMQPQNMHVCNFQQHYALKRQTSQTSHYTESSHNQGLVLPPNICTNSSSMLGNDQRYILPSQHILNQTDLSSCCGHLSMFNRSTHPKIVEHEIQQIQHMHGIHDDVNKIELVPQKLQQQPPNIASHMCQINSEFGQREFHRGIISSQVNSQCCPHANVGGMYQQTGEPVRRFSVEIPYVRSNQMLISDKMHRKSETLQCLCSQQHCCTQANAHISVIPGFETKKVYSDQFQTHFVQQSSNSQLPAQRIIQPNNVQYQPTNLYAPPVHHTEQGNIHKMQYYSPVNQENQVDKLQFDRDNHSEARTLSNMNEVPSVSSYNDQTIQPLPNSTPMFVSDVADTVKLVSGDHTIYTARTQAETVTSSTVPNTIMSASSLNSSQYVTSCANGIEQTRTDITDASSSKDVSDEQHQCTILKQNSMVCSHLPQCDSCLVLLQPQSQQNSLFFATVPCHLNSSHIDHFKSSFCAPNTSISNFLLFNTVANSITSDSVSNCKSLDTQRKISTTSNQSNMSADSDYVSDTNNPNVEIVIHQCPFCEYCLHSKEITPDNCIDNFTVENSVLGSFRSGDSDRLQVDRKNSNEDDPKRKISNISVVSTLSSLSTDSATVESNSSCTISDFKLCENQSGFDIVLPHQLSDCDKFCKPSKFNSDGANEDDICDNKKYEVNLDYYDHCDNDNHSCIKTDDLQICAKLESNFSTTDQAVECIESDDGLNIPLPTIQPDNKISQHSPTKVNKHLIIGDKHIERHRRYSSMLSDTINKTSADLKKVENTKEREIHSLKQSLHPRSSINIIGLLQKQLQNLICRKGCSKSKPVMKDGNTSENSSGNYSYILKELKKVTNFTVDDTGNKKYSDFCDKVHSNSINHLHMAPYLMQNHQDNACHIMCTDTSHFPVVNNIPYPSQSVLGVDHINFDSSSSRLGDTLLPDSESSESGFPGHQKQDDRNTMESVQYSADSAAYNSSIEPIITYKVLEEYSNQTIPSEFRLSILNVNNCFIECKLNSVEKPITFCIDMNMIAPAYIASSLLSANLLSANHFDSFVQQLSDVINEIKQNMNHIPSSQLIDLLNQRMDSKIAASIKISGEVELTDNREVHKLTNMDNDPGGDYEISHSESTILDGTKNAVEIASRSNNNRINENADDFDNVVPLSEPGNGIQSGSTENVLVVDETHITASEANSLSRPDDTVYMSSSPTNTHIQVSYSPDSTICRRDALQRSTSQTMGDVQDNVTQLNVIRPEACGRSISVPSNPDEYLQASYEFYTQNLQKKLASMSLVTADNSNEDVESQINDHTIIPSELNSTIEVIQTPPNTVIGVEGVAMIPPNAGPIVVQPIAVHPIYVQPYITHADNGQPIPQQIVVQPSDTLKTTFNQLVLAQPIPGEPVIVQAEKTLVSGTPVRKISVFESYGEQKHKEAAIRTDKKSIRICDLKILDEELSKIHSKPRREIIMNHPNVVNTSSAVAVEMDDTILLKANEIPTNSEVDNDANISVDVKQKQSAEGVQIKKGRFNIVKIKTMGVADAVQDNNYMPLHSDDMSSDDQQVKTFGFSSLPSTDVCPSSTILADESNQQQGTLESAIVPQELTGNIQLENSTLVQQQNTDKTLSLRKSSQVPSLQHKTILLCNNRNICNGVNSNPTITFTNVNGDTEPFSNDKYFKDTNIHHHCNSTVAADLARSASSDCIQNVSQLNDMKDRRFSKLNSTNSMNNLSINCVQCDCQSSQKISNDGFKEKLNESYTTGLNTSASRLYMRNSCSCDNLNGGIQKSHILSDLIQSKSNCLDYTNLSDQKGSYLMPNLLTSNDGIVPGSNDDACKATTDLRSLLRRQQMELEELQKRHREEIETLCQPPVPSTINSHISQPTLLYQALSPISIYGNRNRNSIDGYSTAPQSPESMIGSPSLRPVVQFAPAGFYFQPTAIRLVYDRQATDNSNESGSVLPPSSVASILPNMGK